MTLLKSFIDYLESQDIATFGQDLFVKKVPDSLQTIPSVYWIIQNSSYPLQKNKTGEQVRLYSYLIYYRSMSTEDVENKLDALDILLSNKDCIDLNGYEVLEVDVASYISDGDSDIEGREIGFIQVNIKTYKKRI